MASEEDNLVGHQEMTSEEDNSSPPRTSSDGLDTLSIRSNTGDAELSDGSHHTRAVVVDSITVNPTLSVLQSGRSAPKQKSKRAAFEGLDYRIAPAAKSPFQKCVERAGSRGDGDVFVPTVGTIFDSKDEAYDFYNLFSWECGFGIRYGKSSTNTKKYRTMQDIVCQCAGKEERPNTASCRTECQARIRLHRTEDHGWYVSVFTNEHNHPLSVKCGEKKQWNSHSVISPLAKDFIRNLRENNIRIDQIYNILGSGIGSTLGVPFRKQTLRTLCASIAHDSIADDMAKTTSMLQDMSAKDPDFKVCVQVDGESRVKTVIWCNGKNRLDYAHFGEVVTFDTTYRTNLYNMPFGLFVGVNNHFQSIIFGGVLMVDEKTPTFEWAFRNFIDLMDGKHPTTILTDQCKAMQNALRTTMPHTRHRWCKWHVLKVLKEKIGHVYSKHSDFKKEFHAIVNEETDVESFERRWHQLIKKYKLQGNKYLRRIFKWRDMWAHPYFMGTFCAGMTSTQRSESANHLRKKFISRSSPMHLFVKQYNKLLESRSLAEDEANYVTKQTRRRLVIGATIEIDAAAVYTKAMYDKFSDDLFRSGSYEARRSKPGNVYKVKLAPQLVLTEYDKKVFTVKLEDGGQYVACDCGYFDHVGLLCCHSLKVLVQNNIGKIPPRNIVKRWTLWARESRPLHLNEGEEGESSSQITYRRNVLYVAAMDLIKEAESGSRSFQMAFTAICEAKEKIATEKASEMLIDSIAEQENPLRHTITEVGSETLLLPPQRVLSKGRPCSLRPKCRMDYIVAKKAKKHYENGPCHAHEDTAGAMPPPPSRRRTVKCSLCKISGHTKGNCTARGV